MKRLGVGKLLSAGGGAGSGIWAWNADVEGPKTGSVENDES
jgi:hypothetical protein